MSIFRGKPTIAYVKHRGRYVRVARPSLGALVLRLLRRHWPDLAVILSICIGTIAAGAVFNACLGGAL